MWELHGRAYDPLSCADDSETPYGLASFCAGSVIGLLVVFHSGSK